MGLVALNLSGIWAVLRRFPWQVCALLGTLVAFVLGAFVLAPRIFRSNTWGPGATGSNRGLQWAIGSLTAALVFRLVVPKEPSWFGYLGEYFNPPLTLVSVIILAQAVGLQRRDLASTRRALSISHRQLLEMRRGQRLADTPWVIINRVYLVDAGLAMAELLCIGGGPALNARVTFREGVSTGSAEAKEYYVARALLFAGKPESDRFVPKDPTGDGAVDLATSLKATVRWENAQKVTLQYDTVLLPASHGGWEMSDSLLSCRPRYGDRSGLGRK